MGPAATGPPVTDRNGLLELGNWTWGCAHDREARHSGLRRRPQSHPEVKGFSNISSGPNTRSPNPPRRARRFSGVGPPSSCVPRRYLKRGFLGRSPRSGPIFALHVRLGAQVRCQWCSPVTCPGRSRGAPCRRPGVVRLPGLRRDLGKRRWGSRNLCRVPTSCSPKGSQSRLLVGGPCRCIARPDGVRAGASVESRAQRVDERSPTGRGHDTTGHSPKEAPYLAFSRQRDLPRHPGACFGGELRRSDRISGLVRSGHWLRVAWHPAASSAQQ